MADTKITALTANTDPLLTDIMPMVDDPGGSAATQKATVLTLQGVFSAGMLPGGRLTLTTATPVTTADVTGATAVYYTPYLHDNIRLYDGTTWRTVAFTEKSITMVGATASKPYDIWGYLSAGTLALEKLVWTDATTRATALAYQNGRLVKNGDATRLYLGTVYCNSSGGQTDDSLTKRNVWNYYNRIERKLYKYESTSHNYETNAYRSWNNDAGHRVEFTVGVSEDAQYFSTRVKQETSEIGLGLDVTNNNTFVDVASVNDGTAQVVYSAGGFISPSLIPAGFHFLQAVEYGYTGATQVSFLISCMVRG